MDIVTESERLVFKRMNRDDFAEVANILQDPEVMYAWEQDFMDEDVYAWIERRNARYHTFGYDYFLACDRFSGEVIGQIGLLDECIDEQHVAGIGYILKKSIGTKDTP
nr:GNAT family N-acetyltransferase [Fictibacillus macauensis]